MFLFIILICLCGSLHVCSESEPESRNWWHRLYRRSDRSKTGSRSTHTQSSKQSKSSRGGPSRGRGLLRNLIGSYTSRGDSDDEQNENEAYNYQPLNGKAAVNQEKHDRRDSTMEMGNLHSPRSSFSHASNYSNRSDQRSSRSRASRRLRTPNSKMSSPGADREKGNRRRPPRRSSNEKKTGNTDTGQGNDTEGPIITTENANLSNQQSRHTSEEDLQTKEQRSDPIEPQSQSQTVSGFKLPAVLTSQPYIVIANQSGGTVLGNKSKSESWLQRLLWRSNTIEQKIEAAIAERSRESERTPTQ
eukprot:g43343.t1